MRIDNLVPPSIVQQEVEQEKSVKRANIVRRMMMYAYSKAFDKALPKRWADKHARDMKGLERINHDD